MTSSAIKTKIVLARDYLSWSQMSLFESSPQRYVDHYLEGRPSFENGAMRLGKKVATRLETDEKTEDLTLEQLAIFLPPYPKREFKIEANFEGVPLLGRLDGFNPKGKIIGEYKTGLKYTQRMADKLGQLTFYATLVWLKYKKLPGGINLHWIPTEKINGIFYLKGDVQTYKTQRTLSDIIIFGGRIQRAWQGIIELNKQYHAK